MEPGRPRSTGLGPTAAPVVSDVDMPYLDGLGLVAALRADPATAQLPVVLMSAHAFTDDIAAGTAVGADGYVIKPFRARQLVGCIAEAARARPSDRRRGASNHRSRGNG